MPRQGSYLRRNRYGARLRDPGRFFLGDAAASVPGFTTSDIASSFLARTPLNDRALGVQDGTVAPQTGAFLWECTLLDLPG